MKIIPLKGNEEANEKYRKKLTQTNTFITVLLFAFAALAALCLVGLLVVVVMLNLGERTTRELTLLYILIGSFLGGSLLCALVSVGFSRLLKDRTLTATDFAERSISEDCFSVGEGTYALFGENGITIFDAQRKTKITVPYSDLRFLSVCTRKRPREKGDWSVVLEIPQKYLSREGKAKRDDPPALVQTDAKERLYKCLEKYDRELLGELPAEAGERKFALVKKFDLPNGAKRKRAAIGIAAGAVLVVGGVLLACLYNLTLGAIVTAVGICVLGRCVLSYLRAKAVLALYDEGIYWQDSTQTEKIFLKWMNIEKISRMQKDGLPLLKISCAFGDYHFPAAAGALEDIETLHPELTERK